MRSAADTAAEQAGAAWAGDPAGAQLLGGDDLRRSSPELGRRRPQRAVRDWQAGVVELVRSQGQGKRSSARYLAFGVNALGLMVMIVVFAHTGGLVGGEVAVAGGAAALSQKILEAVLGDQAVRSLAETARRDLHARVARAARGRAAPVHRPARDGRCPRRRRRRPAGRRPGRRGRQMKAMPRLRGRHRRADLPAMLAALDEAVEALDGRAAPALLDRARAVSTRAGERLRLSGEHTVVALAGLDRQRQVVAVQRAVRCRHLTGRRAAADDREGLRERLGLGRSRAAGAVARGAPAADHLAARSRPARRRRSASSTGWCCSTCPTTTRPSLEHQHEVDRLVELVDLLVWVVDPQKYADKVAARALPAAARGARVGDRGGAQPGGHGEPVRGRRVRRRPAPADRRGRPAPVAGPHHLGAHRSRHRRAAWHCWPTR